MDSSRIVAPGFDSPPQDLVLSVIIPVYNERDTLPRIVRSVMLALPHTRKEIIIVDDGSQDGTREWLVNAFQSDGVLVTEIKLAERGVIEFATGETAGEDQKGNRLQVPAKVRRILQPKNGGKGSALRKGFSEASGDVIVIQDADLEYDPSEWTQMMRLIELGVADVVYGSRFYGRPHRSLYLYHLLGNKIITYLFNILFDQTLTDIETCYKMFHKRTLEGVSLTSDDFAIEIELSALLAGSKKWRVYETGITYYGRTYKEGKKIGWRDGIKALWYVVKFRFRTSGATTSELGSKSG
jgi:glycosyltransferase involved in cell wall biosynthesis